MPTSREVLKRRALRLAQSPGKDVFLLSLSPADLLAIANVSHDEKQSPADLLGADRPAVRQHVATVQSSLESDDALMLTAIVLALSPEVRFRGSRGPDVSDGLASAGTLDIPVRTRAGRKPAWILDGYYRLLALSQRENSEFALPVCAFIADDPGVLREHFVRIQSTHPLPAGFVDVIFPSTAVAISPSIGPKELPEAICEWLNTDQDSPFHELIEPNQVGKAGRSQFPVSRTALRETIADSLSTPYGSLFPYRNMATGETDIDGLCNALKTYWSAVKAVFPDAWGKPPKKSRLMHASGIRIMGRLMNRVLPAVDLAVDDRVRQATRELKKIQASCRWTSGSWEELDALSWDELGSTPRHVILVSNYLIRAYVTK